MITFSDKEVKKIYLGDKKIWEEVAGGAGGVTPSMVEEAVAKGDTETLHILYQADPKKAIKENNAALEMLAEAYPDFYDFLEFPGGKLNRFDLPSEDIYFGPVENKAFGTFVGGAEDGKAFNRENLNKKLSLSKRTALDEPTVWHCFYDGVEKKVFYIPNGLLSGYISLYSLSELGLVAGKKIQTTALSFFIRVPTEKEYQNFVCGLADGTFATLSDEEMRFATFLGSEEWTSTELYIGSNSYFIVRWGSGGAKYCGRVERNESKYSIFRPILLFNILNP